MKAALIKSTPYFCRKLQKKFFLCTSNFLKWFKHVKYLQTHSYLPVCMCKENKKLNKSSANKFYSTSRDEEIFSAIFSNF